jgi:outer membrane protein assembly factor BamA
VLAYAPAENHLPSSEDSTASLPDTSVATSSQAHPDSTAGLAAGDIDLDTYEPPVHRMGPPPVEANALHKPGDVARAGSHATDSPDGEPLFRGGTVRKYHTRLAPDFIGAGGGVAFTSGMGFSIANSIALSDMMGDQHLMFAFSLYQDIAQSDFLAAYSYLKRRADFSFGAYQFSSFFNDRVTSVGDAFSANRYFSERNYGVFALMQVPFNKFYRMETNLQAYYSDRTFYRSVGSQTLFLQQAEQSNVRLIEPTLAFVHDSAFFGSFGPVEGSRWRASIARGVAFENQDVSRTTGFVDWRAYNTIFWRNSIALRLTGAASVGEDRRVFYLGGPYTLRGYDWQQFIGTKMWMASFEYRFPLLDYLIFGWPGRWGFSNIGANLFFDIGNTWVDRYPKVFKTGTGHLQLDDAKSDFGFGIYMDVGYFLMNLQFAWPTDLYHFDQDMKFHFAIGPTF